MFSSDEETCVLCEKCLELVQAYASRNASSKMKNPMMSDAGLISSPSKPGSLASAEDDEELDILQVLRGRESRGAAQGKGRTPPRAVNNNVFLPSEPHFFAGVSGRTRVLRKAKRPSGMSWVYRMRGFIVTLEPHCVLRVLCVRLWLWPWKQTPHCPACPVGHLDLKVKGAHDNVSVEHSVLSCVAAQPPSHKGPRGDLYGHGRATALGPSKGPCSTEVTSCGMEQPFGDPQTRGLIQALNPPPIDRGMR